MRSRPERLFWYRLALALGMTVGEAQARISSREFAEWQAYATIEPFDQTRADLRAGIVAATVANTHRGKSAPMKPADFMPRFDRPTKSMSSDQLQNILGAVARDNRKRFEKKG